MENTIVSKKFLLPESPDSFSTVHSRVKKGAAYSIRISDCFYIIKLHGDIETEEELLNECSKLNVLYAEIGKVKGLLEEYLQEQTELRLFLESRKSAEETTEESK